ncbi:protein unc-80 homolog [Eurytemora carolleeae]|uniref:protein unc-80 homolog n=1 Tax=Eurytemora carolleeae TaxID=1294199 RepID=UPI000C7638E2|nr:protein unc-80 homolog [Eurytemora carolleeae]|eukprot:XP_023346426.1 protein unc-80 homolog [Eurytemora affinis]
MDLRVLLQGLHSIICKEKFSSSRVLEKILSLVTTLLELGILVNKDTKQDEEGKNDLDSMSPHSLIMDISVRILVLLGCPHNCLERNSDPPSPKLRIHCMSLLSRLLWFNKKEFKAFISLIISHRSVQFLIGFFHSYLGFCSSIPNMYSPCSNTKPSWKKRDDIPSPGFIAPFNENHTKGTKQGVQNIILATVFKKMIDKLMLQNQMICKPDNIILHQEIRQFILFVKQNHAGVFRRVLLGGVIESLPVSEQTQVHSKQFSRGDHPDSRGSPSTLYTVEDDLYKTPRRKSFFRKNQRTSGYLNETESPATRSPSEAGHKRVGTLRGEAESVQRKTSTIQTALNWITGKGGERSLKDCGSPGDSQNNLVSRKQSFHQAKNNKLSKNQSKNSRAIRKTFADKIGIKSRRKEFEFDNAEELSLNTSIGYDHFQKDQDLICIKERRLVPEIPLLRGLSRLVFILENTFPGLSPDPLLVGSILDLPKSAILSRACVLIHLAHTVHECNRGNWPIWIKQQLGSRNERCRNQFTIGGTTPKGARIQIQAGKLFHQWGEAVGNRLDDILETDEKQEPGIQTEETINKQILQDEDEDFMDEASVNPDGERCPMVLRIAACQATCLISYQQN